MVYLRRSSVYYKEMARAIYERYGTGGFTCKKIQRIKGLSNFKCTTLRSWNNDAIIEFNKYVYSGRKSRQEVIEWRFTQSSLRFFMGLP